MAQCPDTPWDCHICLHWALKPPQLIDSPMPVPLVVSGNGLWSFFQGGRNHRSPIYQLHTRVLRIEATTRVVATWVVCCAFSSAGFAVLNRGVVLSKDLEHMRRSLDWQRLTCCSHSGQQLLCWQKEATQGDLEKKTTGVHRRSLKERERETQELPGES